MLYSFVVCFFLYAFQMKRSKEIVNLDTNVRKLQEHVKDMKEGRLFFNYQLQKEIEEVLLNTLFPAFVKQ